MEHKMRKEINKFKEFLNENSEEKLNISDVMYSELREKIRNIIASDWANHEDDYPYIENTADECMEVITDFMKKL